MAFKLKTVFIVGAGAHVDYDMPTGLGLIEDLRAWAHRLIRPGQRPFNLDEAVHRISEGVPQTLSGNSCIGYRENLEAFFNEDVRPLCRQLSGSSHDSIDSLLARLDDRMQGIGKCLIASLLLHYEQRAIELPGIHGWHRWLAKQCQPDTSSRDDVWDMNQFSVITFNYDTLFEHHMATFAKNWGSQDPAHTPPDPIHVYGKLAHQPTWNREYRRFMFSPSFETVRRSGLGLDIAASRGGESKQAAAIYTAISEAQQVVFLGFGFDRQNLSVLGFNGQNPGVSDAIRRPEVKVYATAYSHDNRLMAQALDTIGVSVIRWGEPGESCADCLRRWDIV